MSKWHETGTNNSSSGTDAYSGSWKLRARAGTLPTLGPHSCFPPGWAGDCACYFKAKVKLLSRVQVGPLGYPEIGSQHTGHWMRVPQWRGPAHCPSGSLETVCEKGLGGKITCPPQRDSEPWIFMCNSGVGEPAGTHTVQSTVEFSGILQASF